MSKIEEENDVEEQTDNYEMEKTGGPLGRYMSLFWTTLDEFITKHKKTFNWFVSFVLSACCLAYIIGAFYTWGEYNSYVEPEWCDGYGFLIIIVVLVTWCIFYYSFLEPIVIKYGLCAPLSRFLRGKSFQRAWSWIQLLLLAAIFVGFIAYIVVETSSDRRRLLSAGGWLFFFLVGFVFSKYPEYIKWRTVFKGFALQIIMGLIIIKWEPGRNVFSCLGNKAENFLSYAYQGANFTYGQDLVFNQKIFAFTAMSVLYFMATIVHILFFYGWLQKFCFKLGGWMQFIIGTTIVESVNAVTTIFLGMGEVAYVYESYVKDLTKSELHAVMAANFSAVSGSTMAAYTAFGADTSNLITASCMASPTALGFAKLFYPEKDKSKTSTETIVEHTSEDANVMDAACKGAFSAITIIHSIIANLIAMISLIALFDGVLRFLGTLINLPELSFEYAVGKIFIPLAWLMGVTPDQVETVATLIGMKTTVNEFVAFQRLGEYKANGMLTKRSEAIATFALCGFANPGSMSILLAVLSQFAPNQRANITETIFRSFVVGSCVTFMSACIVGMLMPEDGFY